MTTLTAEDLASGTCKLVLISAESGGRQRVVHMYKSVVRRASGYLDTLLSDRWLSSSGANEYVINLPTRVTLAGVVDVLLFALNGVPSFSAQEDERRRREFAFAADFLILKLHLEPAYRRMYPQVHPSLLSQVCDIVSSRGSPVRLLPRRTYALARLSALRGSFRMIVEIKGNWFKRDRLLLGACPAGCAVDAAYVLGENPARGLPIGGVWFTVTSKRLISGERLNLPCADFLPYLPGKQKGTKWGFELKPDGQIRIGVETWNGELRWHAVGPRFAKLVGEPALLLQPRARVSNANGMAVVRVVDIKEL
eukprot:TRINITY_DN47958_c0_g1_i1.p1 TRINITY_DN47958_c0_g1~~TRINITY_DN47958_c0_g1_i1.p1  ORF type:complete len:309 (-),score=30.97 TRINITY_DN47958_c0_g1_i1:204-1130(-)